MIGHSYILPNVCVGKVVGDGVVLAVILELLGRDGGAKEVLQVLEDVLLGRRKGARLRLSVELVCHCCGSEDALLTWITGRCECTRKRVDES